MMNPGTFSSTRQPARRGYGSSESTYDVDALHRWLWLRSGNRHRLTTTIGDLAAELEVSPKTLARSLATLAKAGKIKALGRVGNATEYAIREPVD